LPSVCKGTRQSFIAVTAPTVNEYFAECHRSALGKIIFYFYFLKTLPSVSDMGTRQRFFYFSQILTLPSAPVPGTRQSFAEFFKKYTLPSVSVPGTRQSFAEFF
jgi:hypothetical protein